MAFRRPTDSNRVSLGLSDSSTRGFDYFPIRSNSTNPAAAYRSSVEMALQHHDLQNIAVALSAILRGVPWTVDHDLTIADELVIGVGTVELGDSRVHNRQRFVGITTVFRGDGNYLLGHVADEASYEDYPAVLRDSTRSSALASSDRRRSQTPIEWA